MFHILYKTTNLINGKIYIGVHSTEILDDGYLGSGTTLRLATKKYGKKNFIRETLQSFDCSKDAFDAESILVDAEFIKSPATYNRAVGGRGGVISAPSRLHGRTYDEIHGKEKSAELKQHRRATSAWVNADHSGVNNGNFGKQWTPEMKAAASQRQKKSGHVKGSFWVTDGTTNQKISAGGSIPAGFKRGRYAPWAS
jgi:hypothetical protein